MQVPRLHFITLGRLRFIMLGMTSGLGLMKPTSQKRDVGTLEILLANQFSATRPLATRTFSYPLLQLSTIASLVGPRHAVMPGQAVVVEEGPEEAQPQRQSREQQSGDPSAHGAPRRVLILESA